jgi:predicted tellurium resistance membrane protein TerC
LRFEARERASLGAILPRGNTPRRRVVARATLPCERGQKDSMEADDLTFDHFAEPETYLSLFTLTLMEIVLGIDNIVFISILTGKLPKARQGAARTIGLSLALVMRLGLLFAISWVMGLKDMLFTLFGHGFSGRDLILLGGGLFLVGKATHEIYDKLEVPHEPAAAQRGGKNLFGWIIVQILLLDIVFSLDSVITAVGMAQHLSVMVIAMVIAVGFMLAFAGKIGDFVNEHPSMKILALSFLLLIGVMLVAEGTGRHIGKGYIYFAMAFSLAVELLNMRFRKKRAPVSLHERFAADPE